MSVIQAGDTLVISIARGIDPVTADKIKDAFLEEFPGLKSVVIVTGVSGLDVYRPGAGEIEDS